MFVIYNKDTTLLFKVRHYRDSWATLAAAKAAMTRHAHKLLKEDAAHFLDTHAIAEKCEFHKSIEKMRMTRNILNPNSELFPIPVNTPACCDPGTESYHCM